MGNKAIKTKIELVTAKWSSLCVDLTTNRYISYVFIQWLAHAHVLINLI